MTPRLSTMPSAWKIGERGGPSPRGYSRALAEYHADRSRFVRRILDELEANSPSGPTPLTAVVLAEATTQGPSPPTPDDIVKANASAAAAAARVARRGIPAAMLRRAGVDPEVQGIDLILGDVERSALELWAQEGLSYVQNLPAERASVLAERLAERVNAGDRWESIREEVAAEMGVQGRHLDLIAQDQVAKLNSKVTEAMHGAAGVTHYTWRASSDGRVRDTHREADGKVFSWATGAPGVGFYGEASHPGQAGRCRCTAEPVIPEFARTDSLWHSPRNRGRARQWKQK